MKRTLSLALLVALGLMARPAHADPLSAFVCWLVDNTTGHITVSQQRALAGETAADEGGEDSEDEHGDTESDTGLGGTACVPELAADAEALLSGHEDGDFIGASDGLGLNLAGLASTAHGFEAEILVIDPASGAQWSLLLQNDSGCLTTALP